MDSQIRFMHSHFGILVNPATGRTINKCRVSIISDTNETIYRCECIGRPTGYVSVLGSNFAHIGSEFGKFNIIVDIANKHSYTSRTDIDGGVWRAILKYHKDGRFDVVCWDNMVRIYNLHLEDDKPWSLHQTITYEKWQQGSMLSK